jgi:hypothetical protein
MREGPLVALAGICGALVGRWVSHPVGEALCGGQGCGTFERPALTQESSSGGRRVAGLGGTGLGNS